MSAEKGQSEIAEAIRDAGRWIACSIIFASVVLALTLGSLDKILEFAVSAVVALLIIALLLHYLKPLFEREK